MTRAIDLFGTFVHLGSDGSATPLAYGPDFWRTLVIDRGDWLVGARHGNRQEDFHADEWEMHPHGAELLHHLSGAIDAIFADAGGERRVALRSGDSCLVPRGVWHRLVIREPSDLLFVTPAAGTQLRPVTEPR